MTKKEQNIYLTVGVVAVLVIGAWMLNKKSGTNKNTANPADTTQSAQSQSKPAAANQGGVWEGVLKASDNAKKGNLMLRTKNQIIYIKTSRDFSALIGKNVAVTYEGTATSFVLGNITAK